MKPYNFNSLIRSAARRIWMWSPMRKDAIRNALIPGVKPYHVGCAYCGLEMKVSTKPVLFRVDHINPVSEPAAFIHDWTDYFKRLNISANEGLQILCESCHAVKTKEENKSRVRKTKRRRK